MRGLELNHIAVSGKGKHLREWTAVLFVSVAQSYLVSSFVCLLRLFCFFCLLFTSLCFHLNGFVCVNPSLSFISNVMKKKC